MSVACDYLQYEAAENYLKSNYQQLKDSYQKNMAYNTSGLSNHLLSAVGGSVYRQHPE